MIAHHYDHRHGGPWDRGSADAWYGRARRPHYFRGATGSSERVPLSGMTEYEVAEYNAGYDDGMKPGAGHKEW